jgi:hypothetical protein
MYPSIGVCAIEGLLPLPDFELTLVGKNLQLLVGSGCWLGGVWT